MFEEKGELLSPSLSTEEKASREEKGRKIEINFMSGEKKVKCYTYLKIVEG
jgi:hypothetical protein